MEEVYIWEGSEYSLSEVANAAAQQGLSVEDYIYQNGLIKSNKQPDQPREKMYNWDDNNYSESEVLQAAEDNGLTFEDYISENNIQAVSDVGWGSDPGVRALGDWWREPKKQEDEFASILTFDEFQLQEEDTLVDILEEKYGDQFKVTVPTRPGMSAVNIESEVTGQDITVYTGNTSAPDWVDRNAPSFGIYDPFSQYAMLMHFMDKNSQQGADPVRSKVYETTGLTEDQNETISGFGGDYGMDKDEFISFED